MGVFQRAIYLAPSILLVLSACWHANACSATLPSPVTEQHIQSAVNATLSDRGTLVGQFGLGGAGNAQFTIPLALPPGAGGFAPRLSLVYDSSGIAGHIGVGWQIAGISAISRCPRNLLQDSNRGPVLGASDDRLCLDGVRLVPFAGSYWGSTTSYKTENESFANILSVVDQGLSGFVVTSRDGLISQYGTRSDSIRTKVGLSSPLSWHLSRISDRYGNFYTISYEADATTGDVRIGQIAYTGNTSAGINPPVLVKFEYEDRPDPIRAYLAATVLTINKRLTRLIVTHQSGTSFQYKLAYKSSSSTSRSLLTSVTRCTSDSDCLEPLQLTYADERAQAVADWSSIGPTTGLEELKKKSCKILLPVDLNRDGRTDLLCVADVSSGMAAFASIADGDKLTNWKKWGGAAKPTEISASSCDSTAVGDVNGDGNIDVVCLVNGGNGTAFAGTIWLALGSRTELGQWRKIGNMPFPTAGANPTQSGCTSLTAVDLDGDGRADVVCSYIPDRGAAAANLAADSVMFALSVGDNLGQWTVVATASGPALGRCTLANKHDLLLIDVDGDSRRDLVCQEAAVPPQCGGGNTCNFPPITRTWISNLGAQGYGAWRLVTEELSNATGLLISACDRLLPIDVDGDGITDILCLRPAAGGYEPFVQFGTGNSLAKWTAWGGKLGGQVDISQCGLLDPTDINLDGKADLLCIQKMPGFGIRTAVATGGPSGFADWYFTSASIGNDKQDSRLCAFSIGDYLGDGAPTATCITATPAEGLPTLKGLRVDLGRDLLKSASNAHGYDLNLRYSGLGGQIHEVSTSSYPTIDVSSGGVVLAESSVSDGIGGRRTTKYRYSGLKAMLTGEGSLGFAQVSVEDVASGKVTKTSYAQTQPLLGLSLRSETSVAGAVRQWSESEWGLLVFTRHCDWVDTATGHWSPVSNDSQNANQRTAACHQAIAEGKDVRSSYRADMASSVAALASKRRVDLTLEGSYLVYLKRSQSKSVDVAPTPKEIAAEVTDYEVDELGNLAVSTRVELDGRKSVARSVYKVDRAKRQFGRIESTDLTVTMGVQSSSRGTRFEYDNQDGVIAEIVGTDSKTSLRKEYRRDQFGNIATTIETGGDGLSRQENRTFDPLGVFVKTKANAVGHTEQFVHDPLTGALLQRIDPSGRIWKWKFDLAGRQLEETNSMGHLQRTKYLLCRAPQTVCPGYSVRFALTETPGNPTAIRYFNQQERDTVVATSSFSGSWRVGSTEYDSLGRTARMLEAAKPGTPHAFKEFKYDALDRVVSIETDVGLYRKIEFEGLTRRVQDAAGNFEEITVNARGLPISRRSTAGNTVETQYDVWGNPIRTSIGGAPVNTTVFDEMGRAISIVTPDRGETKYERDGFGRIVKQTDALATVSFSYDASDRLVGRTDPEGQVAWHYDEQPDAIGLLSRISGPGMNGEEYVYDKSGQQIKKTKRIKGKSYVFSYKYDAYGAVDTTTYPSGFKVRNSYDTYGFLKSQRESSGALLLEITDVSARGQIQEYLYGNSLRSNNRFDSGGRRLVEVQTTIGPNKLTVFGIRYDHDASGLLRQQDDLALNTTERFEYDEMRRLKLSNVLGGATTSATYDEFGRITNKSTVGSIEYQDTAKGFSYGPRKVGGEALGRDVLGRLTDWKAGTATLGSHGKPIELRRGAYRVSLGYDHQHELVWQSVVHGAGTTVTAEFPLKPVGEIIRVSGLYEERRLGTRLLSYHYLAGPAGVYGMVITDKDSISGQTRRYVRYLHRDRVGSVVAITGEGGGMVERRRYDPWGVPRPVSQAGVILGPYLPIDQGFAGHFGMRDFGLVYAGGRLYDPSSGLFTAPDQLSVAGTAFHEYNQYGYAAFNPLSVVDPYGLSLLGDVLGGVAGFFVGGPVGAIAGIAIAREAERNETLRTAITIGVAVAITVGSGGSGATVGSAMLTGMAAGAGAGATYTALSGGSLNEVISSAALGAVVGGFSGAAGFGIAQGAGYIATSTGSEFLGSTFTVAGQGGVGGLTSEALGGDFRQSAYFATVSEAGSAVYRETMTKKAPDWNTEFKDGRPHLSDVATLPADSAKYSEGNSYGVARYGGKPCYRCNNFGDAQGFGSAQFFREGGTISTIASKTPGFNSWAYLHDSWLAVLPKSGAMGLFLYNASIPVAGVVTFSSMAHEIYTIKNQAVWGCRKSNQQIGGGASC